MAEIKFVKPFPPLPETTERGSRNLVHAKKTAGGAPDARFAGVGLAGTQRTETMLPEVQASRYVLDPDRQTEEEKLLARCKERCLYLISSAEKTEQQLRKKLAASGKYPAETVDAAIAFLKEYGYLDDLAYARRYAACYAGKKSRREIEKKLVERGVGREQIALCLDELDQDDELAAARALVRKKCADPSLLAPEEKRKLFASLMRKGYEYQTVSRALAVEEQYD